MKKLPSYREILQIAIPMMIGGVSESISSIVDTAFMGKLGTIAMDGMGMTNIFLLVIIMVGWSISRPVQILVAQNFGAENFENIGKIVFNALAIILPISILIAILIYYYNFHFLGFIIANPEIKAIASEICQIRAIGLPILMCTMILTSFYTGISQTKILIYSQGISAISNIVFNYILVFGKFGFPALGYRGSAIATVLSEVLSMIIVLIYMMKYSEELKTYCLLKYRQIKWNIIQEICNLAYPMITLHIFSLGSWVYFFSMVEKMGEKELAISMVLKQVFTAITIPGFCLANTSNTLVGQRVGSRDIDNIFPTICRVAAVNYAILLSSAILVFIFRGPIVSIFTTDSFVLENITPPLIALLVAYLFIPFSNVLFVSLSALGDAKVPLIIESLVLITYLAYLYLVFNVMQVNLVTAWLSELQYWLFLMLFGLIYFWKFDWKSRIVFLDEKVSS